MRRKKSSYTVSLSPGSDGATIAAGRDLRGSRAEPDTEARVISAWGGQLAIFVNSLKGAFNVGAYLIESMRELIKPGGENLASGFVAAQLNQRAVPGSQAQKQAERTHTQTIEINPFDRERKLYEIENKFAAQKSAAPAGTIKSPRPLSFGNQTAPAQSKMASIASDGPDKLRETYHIPAASLAKMAFVFGGGAANDHAATTAGNTTKMVAQLGTLIGVAAAKKAAGDDAFANAHAQ